MFIRKTKIKSKQGDEGGYYSYRIVESERVGDKVQQRTLLNLGKHFDIEPAHWPLLMARIQHLLNGQKDVFEDDLKLDHALEAAAHRYAAAILQKHAQPAGKPDQKSHFESVNLNEIEVMRPRSIGVENLADHAIEQLGLVPKLEALGFNSRDTAAAVGNIVGRLVAPDSELATLEWLQSRSALGELIDHDFHTTSLTRLYQVTDKLFKNSAEIEKHLYQRETDLFNLERRIVLYDLTNTYVEGQASKNPKAQFGRSKEKRSDCRLVTMGLVLDGDGFPLQSRIFEGNVSEPKTLEEMINQLRDGVEQADQKKPVVIMDAGIASEANVHWLRSNDHLYIVVSRDQNKQKPDLETGGILVKDEPGNRVIVEKVANEDAQEVRVFCHSEGKEKKEQSIRDKFSDRFEQALHHLNEGLNKKGGTKKYEKVLERIGRLKEKHPRVSGEYRMEVIADEAKQHAVKIKWQRQGAQKDEQMGIYCLRTNLLDWEADTLWRTYVMLAEVEATFRSLKTDFGFRPVYHQKEIRVSAHLFISLLAYHIAHTIRFQLKSKGVHLSWKRLRNIMSSQQRVTVSLPTKNNEVIHVRTTTRAESEQKAICDALGVATDKMGKRETRISEK